MLVAISSKIVGTGLPSKSSAAMVAFALLLTHQVRLWECMMGSTPQMRSDSPRVNSVQ